MRKKLRNYMNQCKKCEKEIEEGEELCEECKQQDDIAATWIFQESGMPVWGVR